jgi:hypothetical protein
MEIVLKYSGNTIEINRALRGGQASSVKYTRFVFQPISRSEALCIYSISNKLVYEKHSGNRIEINRASSVKYTRFVFQPISRSRPAAGRRSVVYFHCISTIFLFYLFHGAKRSLFLLFLHRISIVFRLIPQLKHPRA